uniref:Golgi associated, gamma adaptin ear containing, ARF binding protein 3b n=1 Tax=Cyprinus carpio TaxID=7962 RepID=A0A8C2JVJ4_CYPCA
MLALYILSGSCKGQLLYFLYIFREISDGNIDMHPCDWPSHCCANKATHPTNRQEDWEYIIGFCDQINKELEGPQIAVRLLVHKIHSQEWEALQALTVLEACMKNCGRRFHNEISRYRFLNELIKVVSPKYMGDSVSDKVKNKIIEMLYSWTVVFPNEAKIADAYQTLKRQGEMLRENFLLSVMSGCLINLLAELLRSKNPEDLQEANRLIKNMVKEDEARVQKIAKRNNTLEEVNNNVKLLSEMLSHYDRDRSSDADRELIKELYERCDKLRRTAFKLATEAEDNDSSLGDILKANDDLSRVISSYKRIVEGQADDGEGEDLRPAASEGDVTSGIICRSSFSNFILSLNSVSGLTGIAGGTFGISGGVMGSTATPLQSTNPFMSAAGPGSPAVARAQVVTGGSAPGSPFFQPFSSPSHSLQSSPARSSEPSLSNLYVPLESIRPSKVLPVTVYDKDGVRVLMHFAMDCPPGRPDVLVMVVSLLNTAPLPVRNIVLQAAVPKSMGVKLQPPSGTEIAPFNPILPPASITQVMLLANPLKERVRLRYKLAYLLGERQYSEVRELDQFPPADRWGSL